MNDYRLVRIDLSPCSETGTDVLAYLLAEAGFESFVADEKGLSAYIPANDYNPLRVNDALAQYPFAAALEISTELIEGEDWNAEWEKNYFQPIVIGNSLVVRSSFHTDAPKADLEIVIDPKMAFGTGHHATTSQVAEALLSLDLEGKTVIDMGTGTGILAILSALRGANNVYAIELDEFAHANAVENVSANNVSDKVSLFHGDAARLKECPECNVLVANINRNVILEDIPRYAKAMKKESKMILSGFYEQDIPVILEKADKLGLKEEHRTVRNEWACVVLTKK